MKNNIHHTPTPQISKAYILGALHDSTERKYTFRISQKSKIYVEMLAKGINSLGFKAWVYKEGKDRNVYIVEFSKRILDGLTIKNPKEKTDYVRGYFDSEGGVPRSLKARYYIYFAQKNFNDLKTLKNYLTDLGIYCGGIHNPSQRVDPKYFRFYILSKSYNDFASKIGSWHPEKSYRLRMKI